MVRFALCVLLAAFIVPGAKANLQVQHPARAHGYFIGDILLQRINLESADGAVSVRELESDLRIDTYLYRMASDEIIINDQRWLELRYQIINSPPEAETVALPAVSFVTESGDEKILQPWAFTIAPLIAVGSAGQSPLLENRRAIDMIESRSSNKLKLGIAGLLTTLMLWLMWWAIRHFRDSHTLAFAKAIRTIKKIPTAQRDTDQQAWIALHHAFNKVAGKSISRATLGQLFVAAPWLSEYKDRVENFYTASSARFYQQSETQAIAVEELCSDLYRAEKRQVKQVKNISGKMTT